MPKNQPLNKALYKNVLKESKKKFDVWPSAYASGWVVREYKKRGGKYSDSHTAKENQSKKSTGGLVRWYKEKWINVCELPNIVPCGRNRSSKKGDSNYPYCRPLKKINGETPVTAMQIS
eukprot:COSAG01_NODE_1716_length_9403_cov_4.038697_1_plen_118_part_10